jgi:hypothetical protein
VVVMVMVMVFCWLEDEVLILFMAYQGNVPWAKLAEDGGQAQTAFRSLPCGKGVVTASIRHLGLSVEVVARRKNSRNAGAKRGDMPRQATKAPVKIRLLRPPCLFLSIEPPR